jgi:hypothetical protein
MKMQSSGPHSKRILAADDSLVGLALELGNGRWAPFDSREQRLVDISISFLTPNEVLRFFKASVAVREGGEA